MQRAGKSSTKLKALKERIQGAFGAGPQARQRPAGLNKPHFGNNNTRVESKLSSIPPGYPYDNVDKRLYQADAEIFYGYIIGVDVTHSISYKLGTFEYVYDVLSTPTLITDRDLGGRKVLPDPYSYKITLLD